MVGYFAKKAKVLEVLGSFSTKNWRKVLVIFFPNAKVSEDPDRILQSEGPFRKLQLFNCCAFQVRNQSVVLIAQSVHGMDAANRCRRAGGTEGLNMPLHLLVSMV